MNKFTKTYNEYLHTDFIKEPINNGKNFIYRYLVRVDDILLTWKMAHEKAGYTMDASQSGEKRSVNVKVINAFKGMLAELVCHRFLISVVGEEDKNIYRYDIVRNDFSYDSEEYDIKIKNNDEIYNVEIRSSISYKTDIEQAYNQFDIIGSYVNENKRHEDLSDIYIRPFYQYNKVKERSVEERNKIHIDILTGKVSIYIIAGAFKEDFEKKGYTKTMGQNNTNYYALKIKEASDPYQFIERYWKKLR